MQFHIIMLAIHLIEQEWIRTNVGNREQSYRDTFGVLGTYGAYVAQREFNDGPGHATKLAMTWYWLNKLKANY